MVDDYYFFRAVFSHEGIIRLAAASARLHVMFDVLIFCMLMHLWRDTWDRFSLYDYKNILHFNNSIQRSMLYDFANHKVVLNFFIVYTFYLNWNI